MSTEQHERIPQLTLGWRLKMSLGEMSRDDIAALMDVTPSTISRWMSDKGAPPKRPYLAQWALVTGVPVAWLESGEAGAPNPPDDGGKQTPALDKLAEAKRRRGRRPSTTHQYLAGGGGFTPGEGIAA